jgi:DNA-binding response OmpR family regulator
MAGYNERSKILVVDTVDMHLVTAELFLKTEYDVYKAESGQAALDLLGGGRLVPDLIMVDMVMPDMNGWEVFGRIRAAASLNKVPVVFLTTADDEAEKAKAYKMGIAECVRKPYIMTDLLSRVKRALGQRETAAAPRNGAQRQNRRRAFRGF